MGCVHRAVRTAALAGVLWPAWAVAHDGAAADWAEVIRTEVAAGRPMPALSLYDAELDLQAAYAVQRALVEELRPIGGYKAGFTSQAARSKVGLRHPIAGVLPARGRLYDHAVVRADAFERLMVEVEIGFVLRSPILRPMKSVADLTTYLGAAVPAIELPDLNYENPAGLNGRDLVATNIAAHSYLLGAPFVLDDFAELNALDVTLFRDDVQIDRGRGANAMGDQLQALLWLVNDLVARRWPLLPGHVLITGTLGQINPGRPGRYRADFGGRASLNFTIEAPAAAP